MSAQTAGSSPGRIKILHPRAESMSEALEQFAPLLASLQGNRRGVPCYVPWQSWYAVADRVEETLSSQEPQMEVKRLQLTPRAHFGGEQDKETVAAFANQVDAVVVGLGT